ncbi:MAG: recombination-associated protein RdgC [Lentisphaeria bacterium]
MPFDSGTVTFQPCRLNKSLPNDVLDYFIKHKAKSTDQVADEIQLGWVTSKHLLDTNINDNSAYIGGFLSLTLRSAIRKVPAGLLTAECRLEEEVAKAANDLRELTNKMRKEIKDDLIERLLPSMPPSLSGTSFVALQDDNSIYIGSASTTQIDAFIDEFRKTTDCEPYALTPEVVCSEELSVDSENVQRLNFSRRLNDEYACHGTIGQDFLTWLLYIAEKENMFAAENSDSMYGIAIDGPILMVAEGKGALESVIRKGLPTQSGELQTALDVGKKMKQAKIMIGADADSSWTFTFDADTFAYRSLKLPQGDKLDPESYFQERMDSIATLDGLLKGLFKRFIQTLTTASARNELQKKIKSWLEERSLQFGEQ